MKLFSDPTISILTQLGTMKSRSDIRVLLMRSDLSQFEPKRPTKSAVNKTDLLLDTLQQANERTGAGDELARTALLAFARRLPQEVDRLIAGVNELLGDLSDALLADGYQLTIDIAAGARLLPTEPSAAPLPPEITALEAELGKRGYTTALNHYRQAVDSLVDHRYEAANGALRSALEDLVTRLAVDHEGYQLRLGPSGLPKDGQGGDAITHLIDAKKPPLEDGGMMLRGLWKLCATAGPHPGRSSADSARSRLQLVTATARELLGHFPI